jgi:hypothetical protein
MAAEIFTIKTLREQSSFKYYFDEEKLFIHYGKQKGFTSISKKIIKATSDRIKEAKGKEIKMTSFYSQPKWDNCPNNILCPYVACLIINQKIKKNEK